jgi:hypothetical protein
VTCIASARRASAGASPRPEADAGAGPAAPEAPPCSKNGLIRQRNVVWARGLAKTKDRQESFVDAPLLFRADPADQPAESAGIDCSDLFDQHSGRLA